ncbi:hypothetical protein [Methylocapsa aurea]|uniref:hypothetical protein n=1 Tax=Methylocapsa aurea TaxID=663610 RepID=UPI000562AD79|nr:hypothetical protein [Methylocapsa aurea]
MDFRVKGGDAVEDDSCEEGGGTVFGDERKVGHQSGLDGDVILVRMRDECLYIVARLGASSEDRSSLEISFRCGIPDWMGRDPWEAWVEAMERIARTQARSIVGLAAKKTVLEACISVEWCCRERVDALQRSFFDDFDRLVGTGNGALRIRRRSNDAEAAE